MLKVENVSVAYGDVSALTDVSLEVGEGEVVSLIGANGAGKTTLLETLAGLNHPRNGSIRLHGENLILPPHEIVERGVSLVPEGRRLWPRMTVRENLELGTYSARARPHRRESAEWILRLFPRLRERQRQLAGTLSGGEQQMAAIARALMSRPRLLLLDEPSLGLAPRVVQEVFDVVAEISKQGVTILLVEQNLHQALARSERGYVLETGRIVREGRSADLAADESIRSAYLGL
jgi:branched-chain amino acid transport system ATP-binding protein